MSHVFISYVSENQKLVDKLVTDLERRDIRCWLDRSELLPGIRWQEAIKEAISAGAFFIACFSKEYYQKEKSYMNEELVIAIEELRQRPNDRIWFIPIKLSDCAIPNRSIGAGETLRAIQWIDLSVNWLSGIEKVISAIKHKDINSVDQKKSIVEEIYKEVMDRLGSMNSPKQGLSNKVQLITYPDSLGGNLAELQFVLKRFFSNQVGGVHILSFYPSSSYRSQAPQTYDIVDPIYGTWEDIEKIGQEYDLVLDFMPNHISKESEYFQDYIEKGYGSEYADMFLSFDKLSASGLIDESDLEKVYTIKKKSPYQIIERPNSRIEQIWCPLSDEQIHLDYESPKTREIISNFLIRLARKPIKMIRLEAIAHTTVELGTNCFFVEPAIWEIIDWYNDFTLPYHIEIIPEVYEHYTYQLKIAERGYWCYDFSLPMLVLHTLFTHTTRRLKSWFRKCPRKQLTTLDTHEGIPVVTVNGLLNPDEINIVIDKLSKNAPYAKLNYYKSDNKNIHKIDCTYYSALACIDDAYIAARAIQFFTPGIPQVYYVGLLAGKNDFELAKISNLSGNMVRHNYSLSEVRLETQQPVVKRLMSLMEFRNSYPAFNGEFCLRKSGDHIIIMEWSDKKYRVKANIDVQNYMVEITYADPIARRDVSFTA